MTAEGQASVVVFAASGHRLTLVERAAAGSAAVLPFARHGCGQLRSWYERPNGRHKGMNGAKSVRREMRGPTDERKGTAHGAGPRDSRRRPSLYIPHVCGAATLLGLQLGASPARLAHTTPADPPAQPGSAPCAGPGTRGRGRRCAACRLRRVQTPRWSCRAVNDALAACGKRAHLFLGTRRARLRLCCNLHRPPFACLPEDPDLTAPWQSLGRLPETAPAPPPGVAHVGLSNKPGRTRCEARRATRVAQSLGQSMHRRSRRAPC